MSSKSPSGHWRFVAWALVLTAACAGPQPAQTIGRTDPAERGNESATGGAASGSPATERGRSDREPWTPQRHAIDPPPPRGLVVPTVGAPRTVEAGGEQSAYVWMVVWEVDPNDQRVARVLEKSRNEGLDLDPGDAGAMVYMQEVRAAGIEVEENVSGFLYRIQDGKLDVSVRHDDDLHRNDPNGFTIFVGPRGG